MRGLKLNKRYFVSPVVLLLLFFLSCNRKNNAKELNATLRRRAKGRAAVVIIRVVEDDVNGNTDIDQSSTMSTTRYLVQRKSRDYPIEPFRRAVCLFGGNAEATDKEPLDTLKRELGEELPPDLVPPILSTLQFVGTSMNAQTAQLLGKAEPYAFMCACYEATLSAKQVSASFQNDINDKEGSHVLLSKEELLKEEKYAWGYDSVMSTYFGSRVKHFCKGATVTKLSNDALKDWTPATT
mmetsp:Transcript_21329/g.32870  ORF Transcript_21329/g.32870 Transcript_21329/m.32870 type:complete len:239 (-) Transcript_21329:490-1206(-)